MSSILNKVKASRPSGGKQVRLNLVQIEFWSAIKVGFVIQLALALANIVGFFILWLVVSNTGLFSSLNGVLTAVVGGSSGNATKVLWCDFGFANVVAFFVESRRVDGDVTGRLAQLCAGWVGVADVLVIGRKNGSFNDRNQVGKWDFFLSLDELKYAQVDVHDMPPGR